MSLTEASSEHDVSPSGQPHHTTRCFTMSCLTCCVSISWMVTKSIIYQLPPRTVFTVFWCSHDPPVRVTPLWTLTLRHHALTSASGAYITLKKYRVTAYINSTSVWIGAAWCSRNLSKSANRRGHRLFSHCQGSVQWAVLTSDLFSHFSDNWTFCKCSNTFGQIGRSGEQGCVHTLWLKRAPGGAWTTPSIKGSFFILGLWASCIPVITFFCLGYIHLADVFIHRETCNVL